MSDKCPCIECICQPICGGKSFNDLMNNCKLVYEYYYFATKLMFDDRLKNIINILEPPWKKKFLSL